MYADRTFYVGTYQGKLPEAEIEAYLARAEFILDNITQHRLHGLDWQSDPRLARSVAMAACALADLAAQQEKETQAGGSITNETVGKWGRSVQATTQSWEARFYQAAAQYLPAQYNLLYRGVGVC